MIVQPQIFKRQVRRQVYVELGRRFVGKVHFNNFAVGARVESAPEKVERNAARRFAVCGYRVKHTFVNLINGRIVAVGVVRQKINSAENVGR